MRLCGALAYDQLPLTNISAANMLSIWPLLCSQSLKVCAELISNCRPRDSLNQKMSLF